ncbi:cell shape-determining protein [Lachnospiraceae bacterium KM106-2]|nr:cell shape-determining protein [Lachnospiraceae bacterium KM106-2]
MKKNKKAFAITLGIITLCVILGIYYYVALPAFNIHCVGFWYFAIGLFAILTLVVALVRVAKLNQDYNNIHIDRDTWIDLKSNLLFKLLLSITLIVGVIYICGSILSSPIVNAKKYRELINISTHEFEKDIKQISYNEIPILDKDSATLLGSRKMGNMVDYVSQFEVSSAYTQINYDNRPYRVSPLEYGSIIKWFTNRSKGIPAYMKIDMASQNVECVKLKEGMKYSTSEHFGRNIYRHLRFKYPTYIFDDIHFEIDEKGTPYWICPVLDYSIGLFGGEKIKDVILVNAVTGETTDYKVDKVPTWIDHVYSADLLIDYYDYYGTLKNGYLNSVFSQKGCLQTTDGYNYIALDDDVWVYTGVTSVGKDESNVGFVLMNQRTGETRYYSIAGAQEESAMESAQGQVQNLGYKATFPLLLNIANEPTYFICLKDDAGLVKRYAMVNIQKYSIVAIGSSVTDCEKEYINLLKKNHVSVSDAKDLPETSGKIAKIAQAVVDGNSHYYIMLEGDTSIYDVNVSDNIKIITYTIGDSITFSYTKGKETNSVSQIKQ